MIPKKGAGLKKIRIAWNVFQNPARYEEVDRLENVFLLFFPRTKYRACIRKITCWHVTYAGLKASSSNSLVNSILRRLILFVSIGLITDDGSSVIKPYQFKMSEIEGFRYRCTDAMRAVTRVAVREARVMEIKREIFNSKTLKTYFDENPRDMQLLRHDKILHPAKVHSDLRHVPEYLGKYLSLLTKRSALPWLLSTGYWQTKTPENQQKLQY